MKSINIISVAVVGTILLPALALAAIAVDGLTAEKLGIPESDFVTIEEAKGIAVNYFNQYKNRGEPVGTENTVIFPWVIESWNEYRPATAVDYYEITVFSGHKEFDNVGQLNASVRAFVDTHFGNVGLNDEQLQLPYDLLSREELDEELFGDSKVMTCWVPLNKATKKYIHNGFDVAIGFDFVFRYLGEKFLKETYGYKTAEYEKTVWFGFIDKFSIFKVDGGRRVYIQTGDEENRMRVFTEESDFEEYFEAQKATIYID